MQGYYISRTIFFLLECSRQKREEKHRYTDGGEEQHGYTCEGEGCNGICDYFFSYCYNLLEVLVLMFIILSQHQ